MSAISHTDKVELQKEYEKTCEEYENLRRAQASARRERMLSRSLGMFGSPVQSPDPSSFNEKCAEKFNKAAALNAQLTGNDYVGDGLLVDAIVKTLRTSHSNSSSELSPPLSPASHSGSSASGSRNSTPEQKFPGQAYKLGPDDALSPSRSSSDLKSNQLAPDSPLTPAPRRSSDSVANSPHASAPSTPARGLGIVLRRN